MKLKSGVFKFLVFDKLTNQIPTRIFFLAFLLRWLFMNRKKVTALDVNEICGHDHEFSRDFQILLGDPFDRDVVDVDLVLLDKIKQKVEGAFEDLKLHFVVIRHGSTWPVAEIACLSFGGCRISD